VTLVDQLAAVLGDLAFRERVAQSPAAAADPVGGFVDVGVVAGVLQRVRGAQPGQPGAHDDDLRCTGASCGRGEAAERSHPERRDSCLFDETRARGAPLLGPERCDRVLNGSCKRCPCHRFPLPLR
jgi:hypothetical protein